MKTQHLSNLTQGELAVLAQKGDQAARTLLVELNTRFVAGIARQYQGQGMDLDDLMQEGFIGLLKAMERFDPKMGTKFLTYASWWIKQAILQCLSEHNRHIRLPANRVSILEQVKKTHSNLSQSLQREPSEREILDCMNIDATDVYAQHSVSYHSSLSAADNTPILEVLENKEAQAPDAALMKESFKHDIEELLLHLEERERTIIKMLYGIGYERAYTLEEIGETQDLTRERVRQIKQKALRVLRRLDNRKRLEHFKD